MPVTREPTAVITEPGGGAVPRSRRCSTSGSSTTRKPSTLARIQPGPVHDRDLAAVTRAGQAGHLADRLLHRGGEPAQLRDHLPGLGQADLRARAAPT